MNERLKTFIGTTDVVTANLDEVIQFSTTEFDRQIDFLRNSNTFPNEEINKLTTLTWRLIGNRHIPMTLDTNGQVNWTGQLLNDKVFDWRKRAYAFEAETLITLSRILHGDGSELELNDYQQEVLERYPQGLKSLDPKLLYPTPEYKRVGQG